MATTFRNLATTVTVQLVTETCCNCGVVFAMTREFQANRMQTGDSFYCPAGHRQHYTETEADKLRRALEIAKRRQSNYEAYANDLQDSLTAEKKAHASTKGQLTKTRKRIQGGVCPDCNRHFTNVERHMATKHPGGHP